MDNKLDILCVAEATRSHSGIPETLTSNQEAHELSLERNASLPPACASVIAELAGDGEMSANDWTRYHRLTDTIDDEQMSGLFNRAYQNVMSYVELYENDIASSWKEKLLTAFTKSRRQAYSVYEKLDTYRWASKTWDGGCREIHSWCSMREWEDSRRSTFDLMERDLKASGITIMFRYKLSNDKYSSKLSRVILSDREGNEYKLGATQLTAIISSAMEEVRSK